MEDGASVWKLACDSGVLEANSCYAYLLLCTDFADTCLIVERDRELLGFVVAYRPPSNPDSVFVWQIAIRDDARGQGLGQRLLGALVELPGCEGITALEATVGRSNLASHRLFRAFARERGAGCEVTEGFTRAHFGSLAHEEEDRFRIGPLQKG